MRKIHKHILALALVPTLLGGTIVRGDTHTEYEPLINVLSHIGTLDLDFSERSELEIAIENFITNAQSQETTMFYGGFELFWSNINGMYVLERISNDFVEIVNSFDQMGNRISRNVNGNITEYIYEDGFLVGIRDGIHQIEYVLSTDSELHNLRYLSSVIINGEVFDFIFDYRGWIIGLSDYQGIQVVEYVYDNNARLINTNLLVDGAYTALLNNVVGVGQYIDIPTGWHYQFGRFLNPSTNTFIPIPQNAEEFLRINPRDPWANVRQTAATIIAMANASPTFGRPIPTHTANWHQATNMTSGLADVELLARMIFGEASNPVAQVRGAGWVVMNRAEAGGYGGPSLSGVVRRSGQFQAITGSQASHTQQARVPNLTSQRWRDSLHMAAHLVASGNSTTLSNVVSRPNGYVNQLYFVSNSWFRSNTVGNAINQSGGTGQFRMDGRTINIRDVHNLGDSSGNVFFNTGS